MLFSAMQHFGQAFVVCAVAGKIGATTGDERGATSGWVFLKLCFCRIASRNGKNLHPISVF